MDPISDSLATPATTGTQSSSQTSLSQEDFLDIMIAELTNQDPLEPLDNNQFLNQLTQMQTLEATTKLTEGIESLLLGQQISSAGALIGQQVSGIAASGTAVEGLVERVVVDGTDVYLGVGNDLLPWSAVQEVTAPSE